MQMNINEINISMNKMFFFFLSQNMKRIRKDRHGERKELISIYSKHDFGYK